MRTVTYKSVLDRIASYLGEADGMDVEDVTLAAAKVNLFVRLGWEHYLHPETLDVEQRQFRPSWNAGTTYGAGTLAVGVEVYWPGDGNYYQSLQAGNLNNPPATSDGSGGWTVDQVHWSLSQAAYDGDDWAAGVNQVVGDIVRNPVDGGFYSCFTAHTTVGLTIDLTKYGVLTPFIRSIAYNQVDGGGNALTPLGTIANIWDRDPNLGGVPMSSVPVGWGSSSSRPIAQPYRLRAQWVQVLGLMNVVFVEFQGYAPSFTNAMRSDTATYTAGQEVYDSATGNCWIANQAVNAGESPSSTPAKWNLVQFPYYLAEFVAQSVYVQLTDREQEQPENITVQQAAGYPLLVQEMDKVERMQGQTRQLNVVTR